MLDNQEAILTKANKQVQKPTFIGIGAPKCATTWISEILRHHPEIFFSNPKEVRYFVGNNWESKDLDWYLSFFMESDGYKAIGEFTTSYCLNPEVPARIWQSVGDVKIIMAVRNPTARFISHYKQKLRNGTLPAKNFQTLDLPTLKKIEDEAPDLFQYGRYTEMIAPFSAQFGAENILILVTEDMASAPAPVRQQLYRFLGVREDFMPAQLNNTVRKGIVPKNRALDRVGRRIFKAFDHRFPKLINAVRQSGIPERIRLLNATESKFVVDPPVRQELNTYYKTEIDKMEQLLDRELSIWR